MCLNDDAKFIYGNTDEAPIIVGVFVVVIVLERFFSHGVEVLQRKCGSTILLLFSYLYTSVLIVTISTTAIWTYLNTLLIREDS